MAWAILGGILAAGIGGGSSILAGNQAADAVPNQHDAKAIGFDANADPLLAFLRAQGLAGIGSAPDANIIQASSPLNRLENSLLNSLGRDTSSRQLRFLNQGIQAAQQAVANGMADGLDGAAIADRVESALFGTRGQDTQAFFNGAQGVLQAGVAAGKTPEQIAEELHPVFQQFAKTQVDSDGFFNQHPNTRGTRTGQKPEKFIPATAQLIANMQADGATPDAIARALVNDLGGPERQSRSAGLFRTALSSAGFDNLEDLVTQEQAFRERAGKQTARLGELAESRFGARADANLTIDRILSDFPAYGASDIERESMLALQPYQAQELEQANLLGYNPATNLALTRNSGIRDALAILSGRQALAGSSLLTLQNALGQQTGEALATSGQSQAAFSNAANLASQQAVALNNIGLQAGQFAGASRGSGTAAAGAFAGDFFSNLGQPGTQDT